MHQVRFIETRWQMIILRGRTWASFTTPGGVIVIVIVIIIEFFLKNFGFLLSPFRRPAKIAATLDVAMSFTVGDAQCKRENSNFMLANTWQNSLETAFIFVIESYWDLQKQWEDFSSVSWLWYIVDLGVGPNNRNLEFAFKMLMRNLKNLEYPRLY